VNLEVVLQFLSHLYEKGLSYSALNTAKCALCLLSSDRSNFIGHHPVISRFMKGVFNQRPQMSKYTSTWDVGILLKYLSKLSPLDEISFKELSYKLVGLLAVCTAHRVQTFSLLKIHNVTTNVDHIEILVDAVIKTTRPGSQPIILRLPFLNDRINICPARTLQQYLKVSADLRESNDLFVSYKKPHKKVGTSTISRWIKVLLKDSGIDSNFSSHSTRHASTSHAFQKGVDVEMIRSTAGWSSCSDVFEKFYNKPFVNNTNLSFAMSVLE